MTFKSLCRAALIVLCVSIGFESGANAQDNDETNELQSIVGAPPNTRNMGSTLGGAYFVDEELLERYEAIKARLVQVRKDISLGNASSDAAMKTLASIQKESDLLREELEKKKVLVSAFHVYSKTSEQSFPLGEERLVIITGDNVIVRGWDGPGMKCVVEKTILAKERPDDSDFDAIQVDHELTVAKDQVGLTPEQRDQQERDFLASENGRDLTEEQMARRKQFVDEIHHSYGEYRAFQGRKANTIQLTGLTHQEGNKNLTMRINSPGGGGTVSSQWQRHAAMTVYVPECKSLAVRGCLAGLDVQDIECDLVLTTDGSKDRDYEGSFTVRRIKGNVTIDQVPVRVLSDVTGDVRFTATDEFVNSGTHHENNMRIHSSYSTHLTQIDHVSGDLQATFLRTDLKLSEIEGTLDIVNSYGPCHLAANTADTERAHRIVSQSGTIHVQGPASVLEKTPIYAYTECGRLRTNISREILDDVSFSTGRPRRGWNGFVTPSENRFHFGAFERPAAALEDRERAPGLDLISHAGTVSILTIEATE
ncbi:MAG: hypothetical protein WD049_02900 [Candidatus Paceibacterota bacterium]